MPNLKRTHDTKLAALCGSQKLLKLCFALFTVVTVVMIVQRFCVLPFEVVNNDNYKDFFIAFLKNGYYKSNVEGTTVFYNVCLKAIYTLTHSIDAAIFILNGLSDLTMLLVGILVCRKLSKEKDIYFYVITTMYALFVLNMRSYLSASNDYFLGAFVTVLLYLLLFKMYDSKRSYGVFAAIGVVLGICFAIRISAVFLIPLTIIAFVYWSKNTPMAFAQKMKLFATSTAVFVFLTVLFHYPSIHEKTGFEP